VTAPSMTIVLAWTIRARSSIQIGTPAAASGSIPLARPHGASRSAMTRTSTPRSLARIKAPTMPEPTVSRYALTRISRSAPVIARSAKPAQSSSGEKQTAIVASEAVEAIGSVGVEYAQSEQ
jgi:hypothetical protein